MARTWKQIKKIADRNAIFFDEKPDDFLDTDAGLAERELLVILLALLDDFDTEDGMIKRDNLPLVFLFDDAYDLFVKTAMFVLLSSFIEGINQGVQYNIDYYRSLLGNTRKFRRVEQQVIDEVNKRLGIEQEGGLTPGGYLDTMQREQMTKNELREKLYRDTLTQQPKKETRETLIEIVTGAKDKRGIIGRFYSKFAYDTFAQVDRMVSWKFAQEYGLTDFIYYGIIIPTSRKFCINHVNKIHTVEEAQSWIKENPGPIVESPATYDPIIDAGGINCAHMCLFLTKELAESMLNNGYSKM
jgi:hypothetical protein